VCTAFEGSSSLRVVAELHENAQNLSCDLLYHAINGLYPTADSITRQCPESAGSDTPSSLVSG
jgi:hypothetical protein